MLKINKSWKLINKMGRSIAAINMKLIKIYINIPLYGSSPIPARSPTTI